MKIVTVIGARPQFIKAAPVSRIIRDSRHSEFLVHTGQHYDREMSEIFFSELGIAQPDAHLGVGSGTHARQTAAIMEGVESVCAEEKPDRLLVYGDTNSTLAAALAAAKLHIPIAHIEAGLRSYNRRMPEEVNRVLTDHLSSLLFCPSDTAVANLAKEGIAEGVHQVGDVMHDAILWGRGRARESSRALATLKLAPGSYFLATVHRAENTDDPARLREIFEAFGALPIPVVLPVHPRCKEALKVLEMEVPGNVHLLPPQGYLDLIQLLENAHGLLTDSGGLQKEAYWLETPCVTLRDETEWIETVATGWNVVAGADRERIVRSVASLERRAEHPPLYGEGGASERICELLAGNA